MMFYISSDVWCIQKYIVYAVNLCVPRWNGRDIYFHITSEWINTSKGVNELKELFFSYFIFLLNIVAKS